MQCRIIALGSKNGPVHRVVAHEQERSTFREETKCPNFKNKLIENSGSLG